MLGLDLRKFDSTEPIEYFLKISVSASKGCQSLEQIKFIRLRPGALQSQIRQKTEYFILLAVLIKYISSIKTVSHILSLAFVGELY